MDKPNLLISSCLCGYKVKYNGKDNYHPLVAELEKKYRLIKICPEVLGGLSVPREKSEILDGQVINESGSDVTPYFKKGARKALELAKKYQCSQAVLKSLSPSCGVAYIYDGTFSKVVVSDDGITAKLLRENGIELFTEKDIEKLL